jgi:hypothetical protein
MPCSIGMAWSSGVTAGATKRRAPSSSPPPIPTGCGAPTSKASSCSAISSPLTITDYRSRYLLACEDLSSVRSDFAFPVFERVFKVSACRTRFVPTTAPLSLQATRSLGSQHWPSGGYGSGFSCSASSPPRSTSCSSKSASIDSSRFTISNDRTRRSAALIPPTCIHLYRLPLPEPEYPYHDRTVRVTRCGRICIGKRKINLRRSSPANAWVFAMLTSRSGSSASCTMT